MRAVKSHNFAAGFTLIELIVAMLMVSMLAFSLYASLNTAYKAKAAADRAVAPIHAASFAADIIARDFDSIVPPATFSIGSNTFPTNEFGVSGDSPNYFRGALTGVHQGGSGNSADQVELYVNGSDGDTVYAPFSDGIRRIDYILRNDQNPPVLVRQVTRNLVSPTLDTVPPDEEVICRNVQSFSLQYFDGTSYYDEWDPTQFDNTTDPTGATYLPVMVKLQIIIKIDDPTLPPDQAAKPGANLYSVNRTILLPVAQAVPTQQ